MKEQRKQLNLQTHKTVQNPNGKGSVQVVETYRTWIAMDKPNISFQSGRYFIGGLEATEEEVAALGFDLKAQKYMPDPEVQEAAEKGAKNAIKVLAGRAGRQSSGTK